MPHLESGLGLCYTTNWCWSECVSLPLSPSPALLQDGCLLAAHITELYKRQLKRMCYTGSAWRERVERERKAKWEGTWVREREREKERKRGSMRGKMYSTTSPSKPWLIPCLLIFITIAASCKMFDGFVQILVPLIHNYCYTCRTKGNFRRGAVWKAAARLQGWWEISAGLHGSFKP